MEKLSVQSSIAKVAVGAAMMSLLSLFGTLLSGEVHTAEYFIRTVVRELINVENYVAVMFWIASYAISIIFLDDNLDDSIFSSLILAGFRA